MDQSLSEICKSVNEIYIYIYIVVSIFLKTCVKDHGDNFSRLLERMISLVCIEALLLVVL